MFKDCFGFEGRIRRLEYGLTFMIFVLGINLIVVFGNFLGKFSNLFLIITIIPLAIFRVAQATKDAMIWVILAGFNLFHFILFG
jgi:uncharacterized membrane protein YhaH (DUF805 family)